jgi:hypothetical protein
VTKFSNWPEWLKVLVLVPHGVLAGSRGISATSGEHFYDLHRSEQRLEFSTVMPAVVTIVDEVDAQLKQQMLRFIGADSAKLDKSGQTADTKDRLD